VHLVGFTVLIHYDARSTNIKFAIAANYEITVAYIGLYIQGNFNKIRNMKDQLLASYEQIAILQLMKQL
jgi:hypothetical protein